MRGEEENENERVEGNREVLNVCIEGFLEGGNGSNNGWSKKRQLLMQIVRENCERGRELNEVSTTRAGTRHAQLGSDVRYFSFSGLFILMDRSSVFRSPSIHVVLLPHSLSHSLTNLPPLSLSFLSFFRFRTKRGSINVSFPTVIFQFLGCLLSSTTGHISL